MNNQWICYAIHTRFGNYQSLCVSLISGIVFSRKPSLVVKNRGLRAVLSTHWIRDLHQFLALNKSNANSDSDTSGISSHYK